MCPICGFAGGCNSNIQQHCIDVHHAEWQGDGLPLRDISPTELPYAQSSHVENSAAVTRTVDGSANIANQAPISHQSSFSAVEHVQNFSQIHSGYAIHHDTLTPAHVGLPACVPMQQTAASVQQATTYLIDSAVPPYLLPVAQPEQYLVLAPGTELIMSQPEVMPAPVPEQLTPFPASQPALYMTMPPPCELQVTQPLMMPTPSCEQSSPFQGLPIEQFPHQVPPQGRFPFRGPAPKDFPFQGTPPEFPSHGPSPVRFPFQGPAPEDFPFRGTPPEFPSHGPSPERFPFQGPAPEDFPFQGIPPEFPSHDPSHARFPFRGLAPEQSPSYATPPGRFPFRGPSPQESPGPGQPPGIKYVQLHI